MDISALAAFGFAFLVFAASPGPDNITIVARSLSHGPLSGIAYGIGTCVGILVFLVLASFGLLALAAGMGAAMTILRYAGAVYLIWMGIRLWSAKAPPPEAKATAERGSLFKLFLTGIVLNLGNPKMPIFYIALLPSVVGPSLTLAKIGLLASVIVAVEIVVIGTHVILATGARRSLANPRILRRVNRAAGGTMVGAGIAVMVTR